MKPIICCCIVVSLLTCGITRAAERPVADTRALKQAIEDAKPGDVIVMKDGTWPDADIRFYGTGTESEPITLRAQTPGKTIFTGGSRLRVGGSYLVVDGLLFKDGGVTGGHVIAFRGENDKGADHCRVTNCAVIDYNVPLPKEDATAYYCSLYGANNRVDHCYFKGKNTPGPTFVVWVEDQPNNHHIDHNHFAGRPDLGKNGGETIRVGTSEVSMNVSRTLVEQNYFENCDGEAEIISNKSCENVYRGNTFVRNRGALTLRHGNRCIVDGNWFFGHDKPVSGGIRIIGEDHIIINNYLDGLAGEGFESAMPFVNGIPNSKPNEYFRVQRALVAYNTFVNCAQPMSFGIGKGTRNRVEPPMDCTIANNLIVGKDGPLIRFLDQPTGTKWIGNVFFGAASGLAESSPGMRAIDPKLAKGDDGVSRPAADSPVRGTAEGGFPVVTDIDGQTRPAKGKDVGCDQQSSQPVQSRPLTPADVGPVGWRPGE